MGRLCCRLNIGLPRNIERCSRGKDHEIEHHVTEKHADNGVDLFLSEPHTSIDSTDDDLKKLAEKLQKRAHWWDVTVTLKNGERLVAPRVEANGGRGDTYGWETREAVFDKFKMLAGSVLKPAQVDAALNAIMSMETASDVRSVVDTLIPAR